MGTGGSNRGSGRRVRGAEVWGGSWSRAREEVVGRWARSWEKEIVENGNSFWRNMFQGKR